MSQKTESVKLQQKTLDLIKHTNIPLPMISEKTNLSFYWLSRFRRNEFKDPSVNKVEKLYNFLSNKKLSV